MRARHPVVVAALAVGAACTLAAPALEAWSASGSGAADAAASGPLVEWFPQKIGSLLTPRGGFVHLNAAGRIGLTRSNQAAVARASNAGTAGPVRHPSYRH